MKQYKITFENITTKELTISNVWLDSIQLKNIFNAIELKEIVAKNKVREYIIVYIEPIETIFKRMVL